MADSNGFRTFVDFRIFVDRSGTEINGVTPPGVAISHSATHPIFGTRSHAMMAYPKHSHVDICNADYFSMLVHPSGNIEVKGEAPKGISINDWVHHRIFNTQGRQVIEVHDKPNVKVCYSPFIDISDCINVTVRNCNFVNVSRCLNVTIRDSKNVYVDNCWNVQVINSSTASFSDCRTVTANGSFNVTPRRCTRATSSDNSFTNSVVSGPLIPWMVTPNQPPPAHFDRNIPYVPPTSHLYYAPPPFIPRVGGQYQDNSMPGPAPPLFEPRPAHPSPSLAARLTQSLASTGDMDSTSGRGRGASQVAEGAHQSSEAARHDEGAPVSVAVAPDVNEGAQQSPETAPQEADSPVLTVAATTEPPVSGGEDALDDDWSSGSSWEDLRDRYGRV